MTWDRGTELPQHVQLSVDAGLAVYSCDPHRQSQGGTDESINRMLRQCFPNGTRLDDYSQGQLTNPVRALNRRPRKT